MLVCTNKIPCSSKIDAIQYTSLLNTENNKVSLGKLENEKISYLQGGKKIEIHIYRAENLCV